MYLTNNYHKALTTSYNTTIKTDNDSSTINIFFNNKIMYYTKIVPNMYTYYT